MDRKKAEFYRLTYYFIGKIKKILDLEINKDVDIIIYQDYKDLFNISNTTPGVLLKPSDIDSENGKITPIEGRYVILINDEYEFENWIQMLGYIAFECRKIWQQKNNFHITTFKNFFKIKTDHNINIMLEKDAYAFRLTIIKAFNKYFTVKEAYEKFPDVDKNVKVLSKKYNNKINEVFKDQLWKQTFIDNEDSFF